MPLVRIEMLRGKSAGYKKTLLDCVHEGLAQAFGTEDWDRFQRIAEYDREDFEASPGKTDDFLIIELTVFPGRSREQKKAAIDLSLSPDRFSSINVRSGGAILLAHTGEPKMTLSYSPAGKGQGSSSGASALRALLPARKNFRMPEAG